MRSARVGVLSVMSLAVVGAVGSPAVLRHFSFFALRQIEIVGIQYLAPEQVITAAELDRDRNIFDPLGDVERRIRSVYGVIDAKLERRLPGTLRIRIVETTPVAFASGPAGMVALDVHARPLPYDPTQQAIDLPVVPRADAVVTEALALVWETEPDLFRIINAARRSDDGGVVFEIDDGRILLDSMPTSETVSAVATVRAHIDRSDAAFVVLDGRYDGLVVTRQGGEA